MLFIPPIGGIGHKFAEDTVGGFSRLSCCKLERAGNDTMIVKQIWTANAYRNFRQYT